MHILSRLGATTVDLSPISEEVLCKSYTLSPVPPNCWHVAGHEPIWGAMTNLAFAAKLPADFRRLDGCRGLRSRTKRGLSDLGFFSAGASKRSRGSSSAGVSNAGASRQSRLTPVLAVLTPLARRVYEPIWCGR